jgi:hypothetical protein
MKQELAAWIFVCAAGCATARPSAPAPERLAAPDPRHGIPSTSPETDPVNTERRFGFAEAKARKEAQLRADRDRHERLGVTGVGSDGTIRATPPAPPPAPAAHPTCPCDE